MNSRKVSRVNVPKNSWDYNWEQGNKLADKELKQQRRRRRRLRKRHLKSEFAWPQTFSRLFHLVLFIKCWPIFFVFEFYKTVSKLRKRKESCCLVSTSWTKREINHFLAVVVQRRQRNVQASVMHVQSCCFANVNLLLSCRSRCRPRRRCLSSLTAE